MAKNYAVLPHAWIKLSVNPEDFVRFDETKPTSGESHVPVLVSLPLQTFLNITLPCSHNLNYLETCTSAIISISRWNYLYANLTLQVRIHSMCTGAVHVSKHASIFTLDV